MLLHDETPVGSLSHGGYPKNDEPGTLSLITTPCKAVQVHGYEKSERLVHFDLSLQDGVSLMELRSGS